MYSVRNWLVSGGIALALATAPTICQAAKNVPDSIALDALVRLYEKVNFNHAKHIQIVKDCAECHHHTTGTLVADPNCVRCHKNSGATTATACRGCHAVQPFSVEAIRDKANNKVYHTDKPGLKGAYHQICMGCHAKNGGPTGCQECHPRNKAGDAFYNGGEFAPKTKTADKSHGH